MMGLAWRLARREMRGGVRGFRIFLACLALGVAAIAGAGSLNAALRASLAADARAILGGDLVLRLNHQPASDEQRAWLGTVGTVSQVTELRAMARAENAAAAGARNRSLIELKAVDGVYPLYEGVRLRPDGDLAEALARRDGLWGAAVDANLMARLGLDLGDTVLVGDTRFELRAVIEREPDRVASVFALGPRMMVARGALGETGLVQPGSLIRHIYLVRLDAGRSADEVRARLDERFPRAGWQVREPEDAAPGVRRFLDNMTLFLTLVGLTALLVGGIGVANAVKGYIDGRMTTIAILKCLGAPGRLISAIYFLQIAALGLLGIAVGLIIGALLPLAGVAALGTALPLEARIGVYVQPLGLAAGFGALTTLAFVLWPLARARDVPPAALFHDVLAQRRKLPRPAALLGIAGAVAVLALLTIVSAENRMLASWFVVGAAATLGLFRGAAWAIAATARAVARRRGELAGNTAARLALGNLHRPGSATASVVLSLGLGLTVLVAIALVEANLRRQLDERLPQEAPSFFFIDIQNHQAQAFDAVLAAAPGVRKVERAAMVRGRITRLNGVPVEEASIAPEAEWAVRGDRGLTTAAVPPEDSRLVAGRWWPADYDGPPLVSVDSRIAGGFGLGIGDTLSVNVLGREITVTIASLREIDWSSLGMNFTFVLSPTALAGAPHTYIATVHADTAAETALERAVTDALPNVSAIRVKEALESVKGMLESAGTAVRAAAALTLAAGMLVLAGAIAAGHRRRVYEAVVLKVLGATRGDLLKAFLAEYGLLGAATGAIAATIGAVVAWAVLTLVMRADWVLLPWPVAATVVACVLLTMVIGFAGTWRALGAKVAPYLRNE